MASALGWLIVILIINAIVLAVLNWNFRIRKYWPVALLFVLAFLGMALTCGNFLKNRYSIPQLQKEDYTKSVKEIKSYELAQVDHYRIEEYQRINDPQVKLVIEQLRNSCNKNDTISLYNFPTKMHFIKKMWWAHKTNNGVKIFMPSLNN